METTLTPRRLLERMLEEFIPWPVEYDQYDDRQIAEMALSLADKCNLQLPGLRRALATIVHQEAST